MNTVTAPIQTPKCKQLGSYTMITCQFSFQPALRLPANSHQLMISLEAPPCLYHQPVPCLLSRFQQIQQIANRLNLHVLESYVSNSALQRHPSLFIDLRGSVKKQPHNFRQNAAQSNPDILYPPETFAAKPSH